MRTTKPLYLIARLLVVCLLAVAGLGTTGCGSDPARAALKTAADLQHGAADGYAAAKREEAVAVLACKARVAPVILAPATIEEQCATAGVPLPYSPARLTAFAGPLNALFEGVHAADAALRAKDGETAALLELVARVSNLIRDLGVLGKHAPTPAADAAAAAARKVAP